MRKSLILRVVFQLDPSNGVPPLLELIKLFWVALGTDLGFDCRFFRLCLLVTLMASDTIHLIFSMFAIDPSLEDPPCLFFVAGQEVSNLLFCPHPKRI